MTGLTIGEGYLTHSVLSDTGLLSSLLSIDLYMLSFLMSWSMVYCHEEVIGQYIKEAGNK